MNNQEIIIYTDGSCSPNPGAGGWAAVLLFEGQEPQVLQGAEADSTNNRMELTAPIKAMQSLPDGSQVIICTDSKYVKDGITEWIDGWQRKNWQTRGGKPVKNQELWQELLRETGRHEVGWRWVKGHSNDRYNDLADQLAAEAAGSVLRSPIDEKSIHIFLGVTCHHKTRTGGCCAILSYRNHHKVLGRGINGVTANVLYLEAVIMALEALKMKLPVVIHTSSGYLKDGAASWLPGWKQRGWKTRDDQEVANRKYWQKIDQLHGRYQVSYQLEGKTDAPCLMQEAKEIAGEFEQEIE